MTEILRAIKVYEKDETKTLSIDNLIEEYSEPLWQFCRKLTYCKEDSEDLFQETFLKTHEQMHKVKFAENPKSFLFSTAVYTWKQKQRKYARRNRIVPIRPLEYTDETCNIPSDFDIEKSVLDKEDNSLIRQLVEALPEKFKIPIILHYTIEMPIADMAKTLNLPRGTVKSRLHKARKLIERGLLNNEYER